MAYIVTFFIVCCPMSLISWNSSFVSHPKRRANVELFIPHVCSTRQAIKQLASDDPMQIFFHCNLARGFSFFHTFTMQYVSYSYVLFLKRKKMKRGVMVQEKRTRTPDFILPCYDCILVLETQIQRCVKLLLLSCDSFHQYF